MFHRDVSKFLNNILNLILNNTCFFNRNQWKAFSCKKLEEVKDSWKDFDVLGIDEGQFFQDVSSSFELKTLFIFNHFNFNHFFVRLNRLLIFLKAQLTKVKL